MDQTRQKYRLAIDGCRKNDNALPQGRKNLSDNCINIVTQHAHGVVRENGAGLFRAGNGQQEWFRDLVSGPEMVVVPSGRFLMGSPEDEPERSASDNPIHEVNVSEPFCVGRYAVTRREFAQFVDASGYSSESGAYVWTASRWRFDREACWKKPGFEQGDDHPAVCISWRDAKAYAEWLSKETGQVYSLLSEAEWEYVARAGTSTTFWWGPEITPELANYDCSHLFSGGGTTGAWRQGTVAVDSFAPNPWGLYQVLGNCWEWTEDCWNDNHSIQQQDGSARTTGNCTVRVVRGGSWFAVPQGLRCATRYSYVANGRYSLQGFRLRRSLRPE